MDDLRMNVEKSSLESERSQDEFMKQVRRELDAFATELHAKTDKGELTQLAIARKADSDNFR
jgi:outer membrane lipopolysaccharide assembly protein LptE/RlpB